MHLELNSQLQNVTDPLFNIAGIIDFFTNSLVVYLILFKSSIMKTFRYYLLYFQFTTVIMDVYLAFLMKPIPIYPVIGGYTTGILFNVLGVSSHIQMTIQIFLMGIQEVAIFFAFLRKHQSIVTINRRLELKKFVYWGLIVFFHFIMSSFVIFFYFGSITKEQQNSYIKKNLPNLEQILATFPSLEIYDREVNSFVIVSFGLMIFFITLLFVGISVLSFQIFSTLKRHKKTTSNRNINQHRAIFQAIFAQFSVISFCFIPPIFVVILLILEVPNTQVFGSVMVCTFSFHSFLGSVVLVLTYPPYRKTLFGCFMKKRVSASGGLA
ncbi:hypothetical protein CRE_08868 [Caenorhabditis remanei]|uniref:G-protein coupled receptors family 1 profile domain-containing protein n=1 Tax=Caenorhabditis remanei TaxID=31234 RepID=E3LHZ0_CAERE|nr:hypothetical protein CRE_08868 [Caenorhabditis remanei]